MSIYVGTPDNVSALVNTPYIGVNGSAVPQKVYIGDEANTSRKVWEEVNDYQYVEYIGINTDGPIIDTGIIPNDNTKVYFQAMFTTTSTLYLGSRTGGTPSSYYVLLLGPSCRCQYGASQASTIVSSLSTNTKYSLTWNDNKNFSVTETSSSISVDRILANASQSIWIFGVHSSGSTSNLYSNNGRVFNCKIWQGNTLVRDFQPCYRITDQVIGMYDRVSRQFFTNAGSGYFIKGPDI